MRDRYGREIDYLRISVTDKCNLRCKYCMPGDIESIPMGKILSFEEIAYIAGRAAELGISRLRITGGEPLVRKDCCTLIKMLKSLPGIEQVMLTTNGVVLEKHIDELLNAGVDGINISIDTLDRDRFRSVTGADGLSDVLNGLSAALSKGIKVRINAVSVDWDRYHKDMCSDPYEDAWSLIDLAREKPVDVRFIEMMPIGYGKGFPAIPHDILIPAIKERFGDMIPEESRRGNGPAKYYRIPGYKGSIGFISAVHGKFCDSCNRIRLTSKGYLKSCLSYDTGVDLMDIIRSDMTDDEKRDAVLAGIEKAILCKPASHSFTKEENISEKHAMSAIGG